MDRYRVVWVNVMSASGRPRQSTVKAASHGAADLVRAVEEKHGLMRGAVQLLEARQV